MNALGIVKESIGVEVLVAPHQHPQFTPLSKYGLSHFRPHDTRSPPSPQPAIPKQLTPELTGALFYHGLRALPRPSRDSPRSVTPT